MTLFPEREDKTDKTRKAAAMSFSERAVKLALSIPPGRVSTYGAIAKAAGGGGMAARSITGILGKAWEAGEKKIPFHRIVYSDGRIWVNDEYRTKRMALYKKEGIEVDKQDRIKDFRDKLYEF
jgi:methylated-DNA-protein-cysteine methyltransferase related protein